jgi:hypothetical protein
MRFSILTALTTITAALALPATDMVSNQHHPPIQHESPRTITNLKSSQRSATQTSGNWKRVNTVPGSERFASTTAIAGTEGAAGAFGLLMSIPATTSAIKKYESKSKWMIER